jgi:hypothetical protein
LTVSAIMPLSVERVCGHILNQHVYTVMQH